LRGRNGCLQGRGAQRHGTVLQLVHQHFHRAGDHRQHVVEIMRHPAGELADRFQLLRLLQLALGLLHVGDVVKHDGGAADLARGIAQRTGADHGMNRPAAVGRTDDDLLAVDRLAVKRARRRPVLEPDRPAVGLPERVRLQQVSHRHALAVPEQPLGGRIRQHHVALGVDDQHRFRHGVEGTFQNRGRLADFLLRRAEVLLAHGGFHLERFLGRLRRAQ
jgi:hypothetical protein